MKKMFESIKDDIEEIKKREKDLLVLLRNLCLKCGYCHRLVEQMNINCKERFSSDMISVHFVHL